MFIKIPLFLLILSAGTSSGQKFGFVKGKYHSQNDPPEKLTKNKEHEIVLIQRLHHLNSLILKDVILKLRLAEKLQEKYKGTLSYELGIITAGIIEHFREMVETYYFHTDMKKWERKANTTQTLYDAYHSIHGRYMQILLEKDLYHKIERDYFEKKRKRDAAKLAKAKAKYIKKQKKLQQQGGAGNLLRAGKEEREVPSDNAYRRRLRMKKWVEKWDDFDPKREGIDVDINIDLDKLKDIIKKENQLTPADDRLGAPKSE